MTNRNYPLTPLQMVSLADCCNIQMPVKAEAGSKISQFVNQYLSSAELVDYASNT